MNEVTEPVGPGHNSVDILAFIQRPDALSFSQIIEFMDGIECWRDIRGHAGYKVSSWGRVQGKRVGVLETNVTQGYHSVSLSTDGATFTKRLSRLVLQEFVGPAPFPEAHAAHGDGNKDNNRLINLRWATAKENQADVERHGNRRKGSGVHGSILTEADIIIIRKRILSDEKYTRIADDFGVSVSTISLIKLRRTWKHVPMEAEVV